MRDPSGSPSSTSQEEKTPGTPRRVRPNLRIDVGAPIEIRIQNHHMNTYNKNRLSIRPSVTEAGLEQRLVLASGTGGASVATAAVVYSIPSPIYAELDITPPPAAPPVSVRVARARESHHLTVTRLRADYDRQVHTATRDLKAAINADVAQLKAEGTVPTAQQMADLQASVAVALNATALRLSTEACSCRIPAPDSYRRSRMRSWAPAPGASPIA